MYDFPDRLERRVLAKQLFVTTVQYGITSSALKNRREIIEISLISKMDRSAINV